jgi:hypothetical protein
VPRRSASLITRVTTRRATLRSTSWGPIGFVRYSAAPKASTAWRVSASPTPDTMMTPASESNARRWRRTVRPSIRGRWMSKRSTWGRTPFACWRAYGPSEAVLIA